MIRLLLLHLLFLRNEQRSECSRLYLHEHYMGDVQRVRRTWAGGAGGVRDAEADGIPKLALEAGNERALPCRNEQLRKEYFSISAYEMDLLETEQNWQQSPFQHQRVHILSLVEHLVTISR